ncbi:MAG: phenyltransferase domain-containing protein [Deltaproteobacteria bacterium]|nr:phenyltransferase domain-containing protein [Deltaproteobacteria bacterium]
MNASCELDIKKIALFIASVQKRSGEIPWSEGGKTDLWDHIESAMGLTVGGFHEEAKRAYLWARETQLEDGSWYSAMHNGEITDFSKESNFSSYIAVGVLHHYLATGDIGFVKSTWEMVRRGVAFALSLQAPSGKIYWAKDPQGKIDKMALLTGSSSVLMSLKCAIFLGSLLGKAELLAAWLMAAQRLQDAIRYKQKLFSKEKARFSMDWYYPILCGAVRERAAHYRLNKCWDTFFQEGFGVRCVSDQPWATMAETAELAISLCAMGEFVAARRVFHCLLDKCYDDGSFWMGVTFPDGVIWPAEKTTWTAGAVLICADTIYRLTPAHCLFYHSFWDSVFSAKELGKSDFSYHGEGAVRL